MKVKKLLPVLALALAATTFAACGDKSVSLGQYWLYDSLTAESDFYEHAKYVVSSTSYNSSYCNYTVEYNGSFTTTLEYNATESIYTFTTDLNVQTTFTLNGEKTNFTQKDTAASTVIFDKNLRPIKSTKKMLCHTPLSGNYTKVDECYALVEYDYTTEYKDKNTILGYCNITNSKGETSKMTISDTFDFVKDYTFIDNEQLLVAVRAFDVDTSSATLASYGAFTKNTQKVKISFTNAEDNASENFNYHLTNKDGSTNEKAKSILCRTAKVILDQENPGSTQVIKFAKAENQNANTYRNVILEMTTPIYYGIGEISYKLTSLSYKKA